MRTYYIGRDPGNNIVYNNNLISGRHAEITIGDDGQIIFTDYSTNGSYVNGCPVHHTTIPIAYGDIIVFPGNIYFDWNQIGYNYQEQQEPIGDDYDTDTQEITPHDTLSYSQTLTDGFNSGLRNSIRLLAILVLSILTCWIPYINVGVFIAISALPAQWATGEAVNPLTIFSARYRRPMGNFLLTQLIVNTTVGLGLLFTFVPGLVIAFSWSLASLFVIEHDMNPLEATNASNTCTYGSKWTIFAVKLTFAVIAFILFAVFFGIASMVFRYVGISEMIFTGFIFAIIFLVLLSVITSIGIGIDGSIWQQLKPRATTNRNEMY